MTSARNLERMSSGQERRKRPRVPLCDEAMIYQGDLRLPCRTLNIAAKGVAIISPVTEKVGNRVKLEVFLPNGSGWVSVTAIVVRMDHRGSENIWGLSFDRLDNWTTSHIEMFVRERLSAAARSKMAGPVLRPRVEKKEEKKVEKKAERKMKIEHDEISREIVVSTDRDKDLKSLYKAALKDLEKK